MRVLSRLRRPLAQKWRNEFSHATLGLLVRFLRRLAVPRSHFSFLFLWDHSSRLQWGHNGGKTHAGNPPGNSGNTPPDLQALERGRRHFGARGGNSQDGASSHCRSGQAVGGRLQARDLPLSKGKSKVLIDGPDKLKHALLQQLEALGIDECDTARNVGTDLQLGRRRRAPVVKLQRERSASGHHPQGRGTHLQAYSHWLQCRGALGFRGFGLHSDTAPIHQSRRGQSHMSGSAEGKTQPQRCWPMPRQRGPKTSTRHFRHHRLVILAWATGVWEGTPDLDTMQAALRGSLARLSHLKRPWCGATDAAATFVLTLLRLGWSAQSARHLTSHNGTKIDLLAVAPKTVGIWLDHVSPLWSDSSAHWNPLFWEAIKPLLVSGKLEGRSLWHRNVLVKLVSRGIWTQERVARLRREDDDSCQLCNEGPGTMFHRCYECPALHAERDMYVSQDLRQAARSLGSRYREQFAHGIFPDPGANLPTGFPERACPVLWHNRPPDGILERHIFTDGSSSGSGALRCAGWAVVAVDDVGNIKAAAYGAVPSDVLPGQTSRDGEGHAAAVAGQYIGSAHALHRLRRHHRNSEWAGTGFWFPTTRSGRSRSRVMRQRATWRRGALPTCAKRNDFPGTFAKNRADALETAFRVAKTVVACASLAKQAARWAAEAHVLLRFRGWNDTSAAAPRSRVPATSETQAQAAQGDCSANVGPGVRLAFSRRPHTLLARQSSRPPHIQRAQLGWDEFSILGVELWTTPLSSAPNVERSTGSGRTRYAAAAAESQGAEHRSCAN